MYEGLSVIVERESETDWSRERKRGVLGSPRSLGKGRQAALSSRGDSIINDASTQSHLGIPYSLGDLLHLILSRVWCGLPLKWYASHIVYHALWMMGRRHSCPNFAESSVNINTGADRMLIFNIEWRAVLNQVLQSFGVEVSQLFICKVSVGCLCHLWLPCSTFAAHLCSLFASSS